MSSVDREPFAAHVELLGHDVLFVENLTNLEAISGEEFHLIALPLAILGRDGSECAPERLSEQSFVSTVFSTSRPRPR